MRSGDSTDLGSTKLYIDISIANLGTIDRYSHFDPDPEHRCDVGLMDTCTHVILCIRNARLLLLAPPLRPYHV